VRAIPGQAFGLRPYTVSVVRRSWSGSYAGEGTVTTTTTAIVESGGQPPKVRFVNDETRALGQLDSGSIEVGPITPDFAGGGTSAAVLEQSSAAAGELVHYLVTGPSFPDGAHFRLIDIRTDRALRYMVRLAPVDGA